MIKYGVDEVAPSDKQATDTKTCPLCGQALTIEGSIRLCPKHGSRPFETPSSKEISDDDGA